MPVAGGEETERGGRRERDLRLLALAGAEAHARRPVDDRPGLQLAIGFGRADLRRHGAGREVPVDPAGIVTGFVRPRARDLGARTALAAEEFAAQQPVEPARHEQLEAPQLGRLARDRARRPRPSSPRFGRRVQVAGLAGHAVSCRPLSCRGVTCGIGIVVSTRSMTSSVVTPSASAS